MEGAITVFAGLKVNISCIEGLGCWSSTTKKDAGCADIDEGLDGCCTLAITVAGCVVAEKAAQLVQRLVEYPVCWVCIHILLWPVLLLEVEMS